MADNDKVILTKELTKEFNHYCAVDRLNLSVPRNSIFGFLGPNGAGKSTTIKMLLGLQKPTSGKSEIFGLDSNADSLEIKQRIGYLPQNPVFYKNLTARETLRFVSKFYDQNQSIDADKRITYLLKVVGISDIADRKVGGFSGGERQRLGIAQAQINNPDLLILDEPAAALDPKGRHDVLSIMETLQESTTIFFSTHILDDVQKVANQVAILNKGRLVLQSKTDDLIKNNNPNFFFVSVSNEFEMKVISILEDIDWIEKTLVKKKDGISTLSILVKDNQKAEKQLLRTILQDEDIIVKSFRRGFAELEEIFLQLVKDQE